MDRSFVSILVALSPILVSISPETTASSVARSLPFRSFDLVVLAPKSHAWLTLELDAPCTVYFAILFFLVALLMWLQKFGGCVMVMACTLRAVFGIVVFGALSWFIS